MRPSWLLVSVLVAVACGEDERGNENFESRILAAEERATDALCACSWSERLQHQCELYRKASHAHCTPELAARLASEQPLYASCIAHQAELNARCLEETECDTRVAACVLDVRLDCGPVPDTLDPSLAPCLPTFRCKVGQEVTLDRRCDGQSDCFDGSDEEGCE